MPQLGRYEIVKPLARGGMAELLLARVTGMQAFERHVAIKRIRPELATDQKFVRMFLDEARVAAVLHHQHIVQIFDVGEQDGAYFFAMEYVHGEDLRTIIQQAHDRGQAIPLEIACQIVIAAAAGLQHAHAKRGADGKPLGLVHRDVSPGNVLVGFDGSVKLVDFGLARAALRSSATRTGSLKGKAGYMSPEQCLGHALDARSDVFALGIVLHELLTGRRLFKAQNDFLTMAAIVESPIPPPSSARRDVPAALDDLVMRALAKDRDARLQRADELRDALERFMTAAGLRTSVKQLADYMKQQFGDPPEPWLVDKLAKRIPGPREGSYPGIVEPPSDPDAPLAAATLVASPMAIAQKLASGAEPPEEFVAEDATIATPPPEFAPDESKAAAEPKTLDLPPPRAAEDAQTTVAPPCLPPGDPMYVGPPAPGTLRARVARVVELARPRARRAVELASQPAGLVAVCALVLVLFAVAFATC